MAQSEPKKQNVSSVSGSGDEGVRGGSRWMLAVIMRVLVLRC
jgi:hypothetical protein